MSSRSGQGKDSRRILVHNDAIENAVSVIDHWHRRIHRGDHHTYSTGPLSIAAFGTLAISVDPTGDGDPLHARVIVALTGLTGGRLEIYESASMTIPSPVLGKNNNRASAKQSQTEFDPTATFSSGTKIHDLVVPPLTRVSTKKWILKGGVVSAIILTNFDGAAQFGSVDVEYYEAGAQSEVPT